MRSLEIGVTGVAPCTCKTHWRTVSFRLDAFLPPRVFKQLTRTPLRPALSQNSCFSFLFGGLAFGFSSLSWLLSVHSRLVASLDPAGMRPFSTTSCKDRTADFQAIAERLQRQVREVRKVWFCLLVTRS
jgi:Syntaxin-5 N-terminal, Sly1p-binding domain